MKQLVSLAALAVMLSATGCTQQEVFTEDEENDESAVLGISTGVLTAETKSVVGGEMITYTKASYASDALGIGVVVLNAEGNGTYSGGEIAADHVWFMGDEKGESWKSISAKGESFAAAVAAPYTLKDETGTVYAYYPKANAVTGTTSSTLTIPAPIKTTGTITIDPNVTNADLKFNDGDKSWVSNIPSTNKKKIICDPDEVDYLYANNGDRQVSNGRTGGSPDRSIDLSMAHALAMVSFRLYNDGTLPGEGSLTKIELKNVESKKLIKTTAAATMNLATGKIADLTENTSDNQVRTVSGYTIPKEIKDGTQSANTYIVSGSTVTGPKVARKISLLTYPIASFGEDDIEVVFTIDATPYTVKIPVSEVTAWTAGNNTVYTVCASQRKLEITTVSVAEWNEESGGNIEL